MSDRALSLLDGASDLETGELAAVVDLAGTLLGATSSRLLVADYAVVSLRELGHDGPVGPSELISRSTAGRAFSTGSVITSPSGTWLPLTDGSERIGVLELRGATTAITSDQSERLTQLLVLLLTSRRRYTDALLRSRRSEPLSLAAEMQWGLLPPLSCSTSRVSVSGLLEPAYSIGGDSFDYAFNDGVAEFAIVDAVGHGMPAVLISTVAINGLRNARREGKTHEEAYTQTGDAIAAQFGEAAFATAQIGSLALDTGSLTWLNAGHPLPLLVRNGSFVGELRCEASLPMGLDGTVLEIAVDHLQPGDRVLFYTDGVTETKSADRSEFGLDRLVDFLVRATLHDSSPAETLRQLSNAVLEYSDTGLSDDATLLMVEYHGAGSGN